MKMFKILVAFATSIALISCSKEETNNNETPQTQPEGTIVKLSFESSFETPESEDFKSFIGEGDDEKTIFWSQGDQIAVFSGKSGDPQCFTNNRPDGSERAYFEGEARSASEYYLVYPYDENATIDADGKITTTIADVQTCVEGKNTPYGSLLSVAKIASDVADGNFKNTFAVVEFVVPEDGVTSITLEGNNGEFIAGKVKVTVSATPSLEVLEGKTSVTLNCDGKPFEKGKPYAIGIIPTDFTNGYSLTFATSDKGGGARYTKSIKAKRNWILRIFNKTVTWYDAWIKNQEQLKDFLANADECGKDFNAALANDIVFDAKDHDPQDFEGSFNGRGKTITVENMTEPLFNNVSGEVKNVVIAGDGPVVPAVEDELDLVFGIVARQSSAKIDNVSNSVNVIYETSGDIAQILSFGSIVGRNNEGQVLNCNSTGAVKAVAGGSILGSAAVAGIVGYNGGLVKDCTNSGEIVLQAKNISAVYEIFEVPNAMPAVGGITGYGAKAIYDTENHGGNVKNCSNEGNITFKLTEMGDCSALDGTTAVGGVVALACGDIKECSNKGTITVSLKGATNGKKINVGGVAGKDNDTYGDASYAATFPVSSTAIWRGVNTGDISVEYDNASSNNTTVAGIFGWPGKEVTYEGVPKDGGIRDMPYRYKFISECNNSGDITVNGTNLLARIGGISGGTGNIADGDNTGNITVGSGLNAATTVGGLQAYNTAGMEIVRSRNKGNITVNTALGSNGACGGMIGQVHNVQRNDTPKLRTEGDKKSYVNCKVSVAGSPSGNTGIAIGRVTDVAVAITIGTIDVYGKVNETTLTSSNYTNYLCGLKPGNVTINANCNNN